MKYRPRRLRNNESLRRLVREHSVTAEDLIYPLFIRPGKGVKEEIKSMPGQFRWSPDRVGEELQEAQDAGLKAVLLFGLAEEKNEQATEAYAEDGAVQQAIRMMKEDFPEMLIITDVCVCGFTSHGHCGVLEDGYVQNDPSLELLAKTALSHAEAGAHMVAPSAMMDGQVAAIRQALDEHGHHEVSIMSYAAKYWSAYYSPFRDAADSAPKSGNRATYQMDAANAREALREMELDVEEGADLLMVKPASLYLDIIARARQQFDLPMAAYNVSAEYSMIKAAAQNGWLDERAARNEMLLSIKRAGANLIITYFAKEYAKELQHG